jgi:hypothetical protein
MPRLGDSSVWSQAVADGLYLSLNWPQQSSKVDGRIARGDLLVVGLKTPRAF